MISITFIRQRAAVLCCLRCCRCRRLQTASPMSKTTNERNKLIISKFFFLLLLLPLSIVCLFRCSLCVFSGFFFSLFRLLLRNRRRQCLLHQIVIYFIFFLAISRLVLQNRRINCHFRCAMHNVCTKLFSFDWECLPPIAGDGDDDDDKRGGGDHVYVWMQMFVMCCLSAFVCANWLNGF